MTYSKSNNNHWKNASAETATNNINYLTFIQTKQKKTYDMLLIVIIVQFYRE